MSSLYRGGQSRRRSLGWSHGWESRHGLSQNGFRHAWPDCHVCTGNIREEVMIERSFPVGAALVVGASGGIGEAVARKFGQDGSDVALVCHSRTKVIDAVARDMQLLGRHASTHAVDVTDAEQVQILIDEVMSEHARLHTVVFSAGPVVEQLYLSEVSAELWQRSLAIESNGFFNVMRATLPRLRSAGGGSYVHMGSAGQRSWPKKDGLSVAPKAINEALIRGIAKEEGVYEIRANSILTGVIEAGMFLELLERGDLDAAWLEQTQQLLALKRWGQPADIANAAVFLASNQGSYITGEQINVSGGFGL